MRMQPVNPTVWTGLIIHALAWGEAGAFGNTNDMNLFEPADVVAGCGPVPDTNNLVGIDFNAGITNHLKVLNDQDQTVIYTNGYGPAGDLRKCVIPEFAAINFAITDHWLGAACNTNVPIKICVDFYDDPGFTNTIDYPFGVQFGPEQYAID